MAEQTFRSPGVGTREIDLSGPTATAPQGTPAGIIGTAKEGPAFVPQTVATYQDFVAIFGSTDGEKLGPLAMYEWMKNARAGTYLRVLGVGTGEKRLSTAGSDSDSNTIEAGGVKNAGFTVGQRGVQSNGLIGNNSYAYKNAVGGEVKGRTYLLGAFMSSSAGSTFFTDAGMSGFNGHSAVPGFTEDPNAIGYPIIRGVVMTPSGVIATLSGSGYASNTLPAADAWDIEDRAGGHVGDVNISNTTNYEFTLLLNGHKNTSRYPNAVTASFSPLSPSYLPNILNTDPSKIEEAGHYLYNYYTVHPNLAIITGSMVLSGGAQFSRKSYSGGGIGRTYPSEPVAFLVTSSLGRNTGNSTKPNYEGFQDRFRTAFSPFVISQKFGSKRSNLFRFHSLNDGKPVARKNLRIEIANIKSGKTDRDFGKFDVLVKTILPPAGTPSTEASAIETFAGVDLNPGSDNFIGRRIGDYHIYYDFDKMAGNQKVVVEGTHPNLSKHIRVEIHPDLANGNIHHSALPLGYRGPHHLVSSGSNIFSGRNAFKKAHPDDILTGSWYDHITEPPQPLRQNISIGTDPKRETSSRLAWGFQFEKLDSVTEPNKQVVVDESILAFSKYYPYFQTANQAAWVGNNAGVLNSGGTVYDSDAFNNNLFTMEQIQIHTKSSSDVADNNEWAFADYRRTGVLTASLRKSDGTFDQGRFLDAGKDFGDPASTKFLKFTFPLQGGFDGVNVFDAEKSKLSNLASVREMNDSNQGEGEGQTVSTYLKALDVMAEKSDVDIQLLAIPGIRETKVTNYAIQKTEERFDALYIMDLEERDILNNVVTSSLEQTISVSLTVDDFKSRTLDTSFAASYFPDVVIPDPATQTNVRCAPSVAVLGALALNDAVAFPWFAPAGFTRGALQDVNQSTLNLSKNNLDVLYDADINPITKFPTSSGLVIFGQKTLLNAASSLDRVNVRRLLIDIRRKVRRVADTFLFEPNRGETLTRFSAAVSPILTTIQQQQGLDRFKVLIDTTTTTQADVENNTIRGKIFLQPTRAVEFISLDFVVTNNGTEI